MAEELSNFHTSDDELVWQPTPDRVANANVMRLMRRHGIADYGDLVRRSHAEIEWFWDAVVADLGVAFTTPYSVTLDASRGIEWPQWFCGGRLNITYNCVDRHAAANGPRQ